MQMHVFSSILFSEYKLLNIWWFQKICLFMPLYTECPLFMHMVKKHIFNNIKLKKEARYEMDGKKVSIPNVIKVFYETKKMAVILNIYWHALIIFAIT